MSRPASAAAIDRTLCEPSASLMPPSPGLVGHASRKTSTICSKHWSVCHFSFQTGHGQPSCSAWMVSKSQYAPFTSRTVTTRPVSIAHCAIRFASSTPLLRYACIAIPASKSMVSQACMNVSSVRSLSSNCSISKLMRTPLRFAASSTGVARDIKSTIAASGAIGLKFAHKLVTLIETLTRGTIPR